MHNETISELESYTDYVEFERLCSDILTGLGYRGLDPQGVEGRDAGKDAVLRINEEEQIVFHFSTREDWENKLYDDLEKVEERDITCSHFVFASNRQISPGKKDELRNDIPPNYDWNFDIFDAERLRVELDNHRQDLRRRYLGIPKSHDSHIDEIIDELVNDRANEVLSYVPAENYFKRVLILAIPIEHNPTRMGLFDEQYNFEGEREELRNQLSIGLPVPESEVRSIAKTDQFSAYYEQDRNPGTSLEQAFRPYAPNEPIHHESNLYNSGVLELLYEIPNNTVEENDIRDIIDSFFRMCCSVLRAKIGSGDNIYVAFFLLNADSMYIEKNGIKYGGEDRFFQETEEESFQEICSEGFQNDFKERVVNRIDLFFNEKQV